MSSAPRRFVSRKGLHLKTTLSLISLILLTKAGFAATAASTPASLVSERAVREFVGNCGGELEFEHKPYSEKLPNGFRAERVEVHSDNPTCGGNYIYVSAPNEDYFVGNPWPISDYAGTPEQKLKKFTWEKLQETFDVVPHPDQKRGTLYRVDLLQTTEQGKIPLSGYVDPAGTAFFLGNFMSPSKSAAEQRVAQIGSVVRLAPARGSENAKITVYEFSDFECPSCRAASVFMKPLLEKYGDKIRYVRIDLPLVSAHPWAFSAALMGRAIYKQSPAAFWEYKEAIYSNQDKLNNFALEDFVNAFVADHDLDQKRFAKDISSEELKQEIVNSIAGAYSVPVLATPTYLVNGELVSPGKDGVNLDKFIAAKLAQ